MDIEFVVQVAVLKLGPRHRQLRLTSTRQVLAQWLEMKCHKRREADFLLHAYDRLREVEKGMRMDTEQASNTLPAGRELAGLAQALGHREPQDFEEDIKGLMKETRHIFDRLLADLADGG